MTASPAYNVRVLLQAAAASTALTNEPMTRIAGTNSFQITDETKRVLDREATFNFTIAGGGVSNLEIDYARGIITAPTAIANSVQNALVVSGKYYPVSDFIEAKSYSLEMSAELLDATTFKSARDNGGYRSRYTGLRDVTLTIEALEASQALGAGASSLIAIIRSRVFRPLFILIETSYGATFRGWFVLEDHTLSGDIASLQDQSLTFKLDSDPKTALSWNPN